MDVNKIYNQDCLTGLKTLPDNYANCCVTSPPYFGLRDYGTAEQIGLEETPELFVSKLVNIFREVKRVLKDDGTLWLNLGDSYSSGGSGQNFTIASGSTASGRTDKDGGFGHINNKRNPKDIGLKPKDLIGIPWLVAFALRADGWYLRQDIIWSKPNPMPESVTDRCTKSHEYIFLLSKSAKYFYDADAIKEKSKTGQIKRADTKKYSPTNKINGIRADLMPTELANKRSVWTVTTRPYSEAHFATFPERLITDCIKAGCPVGGTILDPFMGAGTTALVARKLDRNYVGFELNPAYIEIANKRLQDQLGMFI